VTLVLATRNEHKLREFAALLDGIELVALPDGVELPPETGATFTENALPKARTAASATGLVAFADDSGIEAAALGGAPGVRSARFAGEHASDTDNLTKLIANAPPGSALAYVCVIALVDPRTGEEHTFEGRCTGTMASAARGSGGFGYDPVFVPDDRDDGRTMAELSAAEKAAIGHRGRAARALLGHLRAAAAEAGATTVEAGATTVDAGATTVDAGATTADAGATTAEAGEATRDAGAAAADASAGTAER
jgi:XTP/dITP diphosphohydrolase